MKIDPRALLQGDNQTDLVKKANGQVDQSQARTKTEGVSSPNSEDTFTLSSTLGDAQRLNNNLISVPEIRAERVQTLQRKVQSGTYTPDNQKIAAALVNEHTSLNVKA
jgi:flagellar biosynthesis anti-sigma factor FlgM